jgi:hypothetical protein
MMPTVLREGPYRIMIYSHDHPPAHVHVVRDGRAVKIELTPDVQIVYYHPKLRSEIGKIKEVVTENLELLMEKWNELHGDEEDEP